MAFARFNPCSPCCDTTTLRLLCYNPIPYASGRLYNDSVDIPFFGNESGIVSFNASPGNIFIEASASGYGAFPLASAIVPPGSAMINIGYTYSENYLCCGCLIPRVGLAIHAYQDNYIFYPLVDLPQQDSYDFVVGVDSGVVFNAGIPNVPLLPAQTYVGPAYSYTRAVAGSPFPLGSTIIGRAWYYYYLRCAGGAPGLAFATTGDSYESGTTPPDPPSYLNSGVFFGATNLVNFTVGITNSGNYIPYNETLALPIDPVEYANKMTTLISTCQPYHFYYGLTNGFRSTSLSEQISSLVSYAEVYPS